MSKRKPLDTQGSASRAKAVAKQSSGSPAPALSAAKKRVTSINIPTETLQLLQAAAFRRAQRTGGRFSISAFLVEFIEQHRGELEM